MLTRIDDFFTFLSINKSDREAGIRAAALAGERALGMTHTKDYEALSAVTLHYRPKHIFETGTYLGVTSDFFLSLLPECEVASVAYSNPRMRILGKFYNNSELTRDQIGSEVLSHRKARFMQLYGDSHKLNSQLLVKEHGYFDLVFIDGDHSAQGVSQDTELAKKITTQSGVICWHDANPKPKYIAVRRFLEEDLSLPAIAIRDEYLGGIAVWSREIEDILNSRHIIS